ncbi:MAG TPA: thiamine pyrophosphate-dependent enzyme [Gemmatimonadales bacterium]|jgi:transketolase|nr:thiamine pyrophosphate-dependent enzyme [Gemmatimonadales bacterium]
MSLLDVRELDGLAREVRRHAIRMAGGGGCFLGASLSCADLLVYLYRHFLRVDPRRLDDPARDYLLLSKGHDVPALYGTLAELGFIPRARLANHLSLADHLYWHPNRHIPGVEFHSGSLGHLLSVGMGIAYDIRITHGENRVVVLLGDGELNEGSIWEALLVAKAHGLWNLTLLVDRNGFQANERTEDLIPLEPLADKFAAFGCPVRTVDGHDFEEIHAAFEDLPFGGLAPSVIIARTIRGCGLPSIEARADRWFVRLAAAEVDALLGELDGVAPAELESEPLVVR